MDDRPWHAYLIGAFSATVAFGVVALALSSWKAWTALGLACGCLMAAGVCGILIYRDRPRLFIGHPSVWDIAITREPEEPWHSVAFTTSDFYMSSGPRDVDYDRAYQAVYLEVWNEPRRDSSTRRARDVYVWLRFLQNDEELYDIVGRWSDLDQKEAPETYSIPRVKDLAPNGRRLRIDVAGLIDGVCYALNDQARHRGYKVFPLPRGPVVVEVTARGIGSLKKVSQWLLTEEDGELGLSPFRNAS